MLSPVGEAPLLPGVTIRFNNDQHIPLIPVRLGDDSFIALIDSGSDGPFLLNPFGLNPRYKVQPRPGAIVGNLTGNREQEIGRLDESLGLGIYTVQQPVVDITDQLSAIGGEILKYFSVTFDQAHSRATFFRQATTPIAPQGLRHCGLSFSKKSVYWRVEGVISGSPAEAMGIQTGDLVTRINGESVSAWNLQRFESLTQRATEITFTLLDGSREEPKVVPTFALVP
jgi:membrane-associated protease RseP (regulator of RpoE activity)